MTGAFQFLACDAAWKKAAESHQVRLVQKKLPAGVVRFSLLGQALERHLLPFAHLADVPEEQEPDLVVQVLHLKECPGGPVLPQLFRPEPTSVLEIIGQVNERFVGYKRPGVTSWFDRSESRLISIINDQSQLLPTDQAKPLHPLWLLWHHERKAPIIHAALVSHGGKGILFVGPPNSGKSSVAYRCLQENSRLVSDDYTALLSCGSGAGLYSSIWFEEEFSRNFSDLSLGLMHRLEPKVCFPLAQEFMERKAPIGRVVRPCLISPPRLDQELPWRPSEIVTSQPLAALEVPTFRLGLNGCDKDIADCLRRVLND